MHLIEIKKCLLPLQCNHTQMEQLDSTK